MDLGLAHELPVLPLDDAVLLPGMSVSFPIINDEQAAAVEHAVDGRLVAVPRLDGTLGTLGTILQITGQVSLPDGTRAVSVEVVCRAELGAGSGDPLVVSTREIADVVTDEEEATGLATEYRAIVEEIAAARGDSGRVGAFLRSIDDPGRLADTVGYAPEIPVAAKADVLAAIDVTARLRRAVEAQRQRLAEIDTRKRILNEVTEGMEKSQREAILRRQMDAIQRELDDNAGTGTEDWRRRIEDAGMPEAARAEAERELGRLERHAEGPEAGMIRTYLEWMVSIPWNVRSDDRLDIDEARRVLDADHAGLDKVKERVVEHLAVRKLRRDRDMDDAGSGVILSLVGPPGVGKTSLGESVARAMGREFVRISLGGVRDESEIRGHRRTYVGALPGRLVRALRDAGTRNPVVLLDEIDKVGSDWRGDPTSALLEVLDPAQNHTFRDHYLDVELDLSEVLFIATANVTDTIPQPLLDRMEVIHLDGYTEDEKLAIARGYLLPRQIERNGVHPHEVEVTDEAIRHVVRDHTREAGVRTLDRHLATVVRKTALKIAAGTESVTVDADDLRELLGRPVFHHETADRTATPGVATGLAVTGTGGDVLFIEASALPGGDGSGLILTGQLGDVMRESGRIALSWVRANAETMGIDAQEMDGRQVHLHVPAGAIPKDGPSAGVTMITAIASLFSGRSVRPHVGMTGEVTLQGRVLPIGGVKQKLLAAHRAGLTDVIIPERNRGDLDDVPASVLDEVRVHPVLTVDEALRLALEPCSAAVEAATS